MNGHHCTARVHRSHLGWAAAAILLIGAPVAQAQVKIGTNPITINPGSLLELESTDKGLLVPRIALTGRTNWGLNGNQPVDGMVVYNTKASTGTNGLPQGLMVWRSGQWVSVDDTPYLHVNSALLGNSTAANSGAIGANAIAVGPKALVNGDNGVGIGNGAVVQVAAVDGVAIGSGATASQAGGVALGSESIAATGAGVAGYVPNGVAAAQATAVANTTSTRAAVSVGDPSNGVLRQITGVAAGTADTDAANISQLKAVQSTVTALDQGAVKYDTNPNGSANYNSVTLGGVASTGPVALHNVAAGTASTDAVNVGQLNAATSSLKYVHVNSSAADSIATGAEAISIGPKTVVGGDNGVGIGDGAVVQQSATGGVAIGNGASVSQVGGVALGSQSIATTAAGVAGYVPGSATASQRAAVVSTTSTRSAVSVGDASNGVLRQITGVAAGTADSDATNVSQLKAVQASVSTLDESTVKYEKKSDGSTDYNSVTLGSSTATGPVTVRNVAPGVAGNDAVNVNQLNAVKAALGGRIDAVNSRIDALEKYAYAGVAAAMATQMPASYVPGKTAMRLGVGTFRGESAVGIAFRRTAENNGWSVTAGGSVSRAGVAATAGAEWVLN